MECGLVFHAIDFCIFFYDDDRFGVRAGESVLGIRARVFRCLADDSGECFSIAGSSLRVNTCSQFRSRHYFASRARGL